MLKVGIVGMGVIGKAVAKAASGDIPGVTLAGRHRAQPPPPSAIPPIRSTRSSRCD